MRDFANLGLAHCSERRQCATQLRLAQTEQKVGLVLPWIDTLSQHSVPVAGGADPGRSRLRRRIGAAGVTDPGYNVFDDRVMAGRDVIAAERLRLLPEIAELQFLVAHHAWVRGSPSLVCWKIIDHQPLKLIGFINHVMRNTEHVRHVARVSHGLRPATFVFRARNAVLRPDFHRHADDVVALLAQQITGDAGVHSTAHPKKNALIFLCHWNRKFPLIAD